LGDLLRADEHRALGSREPLERLAQRFRPLDRVGVEAEALELRHLRRELALELLRPRADPGELCGAALRANARSRLGEAAVMTAERAVAVERERDVAQGAAA